MLLYAGRYQIELGRLTIAVPTANCVAVIAYVFMDMEPDAHLPMAHSTCMRMGAS